MTSLKPFYDGNHFTSKQTEHKYQPKQLMGMSKVATILWVFIEKLKLKQLKLHPSVLESETREKFERVREAVRRERRGLVLDLGEGIGPG
jgi:hypothetical protein